MIDVDSCYRISVSAVTGRRRMPQALHDVEFVGASRSITDTAYRVR